MIALSLAAFGQSQSDWLIAAEGAEAAGFTTVWSNELHRTALVPLAAAAGVTRRVSLGTGVALAFARSPLITALEALDVDELSNGRLILGLGTGVRRLIEDWHGAAFDEPAERLRETVAIIRSITVAAHRGEPISVSGRLVSTRITGWKRPSPPARDDIPIYLAAMGPRLTRLAGEVADGWIAHELGSPEYLKRELLPTMEVAAREAGRPSKPVVIASACCVPLDDRVEARRLAAHQIAFYASVRTYQAFFAWHGFEAQALRCQEAFRNGDRNALVEAISDDMVDALTITGTTDEVKAALARYDGLADGIKLGPPVHGVDPAASNEIQRRILSLGPSA